MALNTKMTWTEIKANNNRQFQKSKELFRLALAAFGLSELPYVQLEDIAGDKAKYLDTKCGIDALVRFPWGIKSFASRCRTATKDRPNIYRQFTIRKKTQLGNLSEFGKRSESIQNHSELIPYFTFQVWFDSDNNVICGAIIKTEDLYDYIKKYSFETEELTNEDGSIFIAASWEVIKKRGYNVKII